MRKRFIKKHTKKFVLLAVLLVLLVLLLGLLFVLESHGPAEPETDGVSSYDDPTIAEDIYQEQSETKTVQEDKTGETELLMPWDEPGVKQPEEYTWEEYESLSEAQQEAFQKHFGAEGFAAWTEYVQSFEEENPWELPGAKRPEDYTMEDYEALTEPQKNAFLEYLGPEGVEVWLNKNQDTVEEYPWEKPGAKQPKNYTWAEYQALTNSQKLAFRKHLGEKGFQNWMNKVQGQKKQNPWDKPGSKRPQYYTWEEYEALTDAQKKAFRDYLGTKKFEQWLERVQKEKNPWEEPGAKQPEDYTWEEYDALSEVQKLAFQENLGARGFEAWKEWALKGGNPWEKPDAKQPGEYTWEEYKALTDTQKAAFESELGPDGFQNWLEKITDIPWKKANAKQPKDYTWEEYEALTEAQKLAFRTRLGVEGFAEWKLAAQNPEEENPWEKPGAKKPEDYTMEEFEALTVEQQMAFQEYLGEKGFEEWLNKVQNSETSKNPWEEPGAKKPEDYTMEEFEALTVEQQMAFQKYLGEEGFEEWLNWATSEAEDNP